MASNSGRAANSFMPLYGGDYLRDTMHLSAAEDGIYLRLLMHYWHSQHPLPVDRRKVEGIARVQNDAERAALDSVLSGFFQKDLGGWRNKRMDHEIQKGKEIQERLSIAGRKGGLSRAKAWVKGSLSTAKATRSQSTATATAIPEPEPQPDPPPPKNRTGKHSDAATQRGPEDQNGKGKTKEAESAYREAMAARYGVDPGHLNGKQRGMLGRFLDRVPVDEAAAIIRHYVESNRGLYVSASHCVDLLLRDAESLRIAWHSGTTVTDTAARMADQTQTRGDVFKKLIKEVDHGE